MTCSRIRLPVIGTVFEGDFVTESGLAREWVRCPR